MAGSATICVHIEVRTDLVRKIIEERIASMVNRDIDLAEWLNGLAFHPANSERKQLGHEAARQQVAWLGELLHGLLPPGRDKSIAFTALEDVLMRANRALAIEGGPNEEMDTDSLRRLATAGPLEADPRVETYKAEQRGEDSTGRLSGAGYPYWASSINGAAGEPWALGLDARPGRVSIATVCNDPRNVSEVCQEFLAGRQADPTGPFRGFVVQVDDPDHLSAILRELAIAGEHAFGAPETAAEPSE